MLEKLSDRGESALKPLYEAFMVTGNDELAALFMPQDTDSKAWNSGKHVYLYLPNTLYL